MKQLLLMPVLLSISLVGCSSPQEQSCQKIETEIVSTWKEGEALKSRSQNAIVEMNTMIKIAQLGGALPDKEKFARASVESERATSELSAITEKVTGFPDKVAEAGCSAERFEKFKASHPEIFG